MKSATLANVIAWFVLSLAVVSVVEGKPAAAAFAYFGACFFFLLANQLDQAEALREITRRLDRRREKVYRVEYRISWRADPRPVCPLAKQEDQ